MSVFLLILVLVISVAVAASFWSQLRERHQTNGRILELESKLEILSKSIVPINNAFQAVLIKELTHLHTPEMDALLVKVGPPNILTLQEETRLSQLLIERAADHSLDVTESERDAARILPAVIRRAHQETLTLAAAEVLKGDVGVIAAVVKADVIEK